MKTKKRTRISALALVVVLAFSIMADSGICTQAQAATLLAAYSFNQSDGASTAKDLNDTYKTNADSGYLAASGKYSSSSRLYASVNSPSDSSYRKLEWSKDSDYSYNGSAQKAMPIMAASKKNPWGTAPYFLIKTSTSGFEDITFAFRIGGTKKGPKEYKLQYSLNGNTYTDISNTNITLKANKTLYDFTFSLPSSTEDQSQLYLKIVAASAATIEGSTLTADTESGEAAINTITISGTAATTKATPAPTVKPTINATAKPSTSSNNSSSASSNNINAGTTTAPSGEVKSLSSPKLTTYKAGSKTIKGTAPKKSTVTVKIGKVKYTATASKKGSFKVKLKTKLKKGKSIKVYASKSGYNNSKTKSYKVK